MTPVKRFDIIIEALHTQEVVKAIDAAGIDGYTLIRDVAGRGDRGERMGDELTDVFRNCCFIVAVPEAKAARFQEALRPILHDFGGVCLVSDSLWLKH